jgi:hypothetical protein
MGFFLDAKNGDLEKLNNRGEMFVATRMKEREE